MAESGAGGIRTLGTVLRPYNGLANHRLQPLGHSSLMLGQAGTTGIPGDSWPTLPRRLVKSNAKRSPGGARGLGLLHRGAFGSMDGS